MSPIAIFVKKREHMCIVDIVAAKSDPISVRLMELTRAKKGLPTPELRRGGDAMWTTRENGDVVFIGPGLLRRGGAILIQKAEECALEYVEKIAAEARTGLTSPLSRKPGKGSQDSPYAKFWGRAKIERKNGGRPFTGNCRAIGKFNTVFDEDGDLFSDSDSEVDVEREELEKESLGNYDGIILKNPLSSSLFEYGADLFPESIFNAVRGEPSYPKVVDVAIDGSSFVSNRGKENFVIDVASLGDALKDDMVDLDSEVDVEREELEKESLGNYDGIILKNPLSSSLFEYGADLFPKSAIFNAVRGEPSYYSNVLVDYDDREVRLYGRFFDFDGQGSFDDVGAMDMQREVTRSSRVVQVVS